jgi:hypothetical protein
LFQEKVEAAGIEPVSADDAADSAISGCDNQAESCAALALQLSDFNCLSLASIDANLREVVLAWSALPVTVRQAILVLARNCGNQK